MAEQEPRRGERWQVTVVPAGTLPEAEAAAGRARRQVAEWLKRRMETGGTGECS